jgi:hypothetical protein
VLWSEFQACFDRGVNVFHILREIVAEYVSSYHPAKQVRGRMAPSGEPERMWTIHFDPEKQTFGISGQERGNWLTV